MFSNKNARALGFLDHLEGLLTLEREAERARYLERLRMLSPEEREEQGFGILDMEIVEDGFGLGGRLLLTFQKSNRVSLPGRFKIGDVVELRPKKGEEGETARAVIFRRSALRLTLALDKKPPFPLEGLFALDLAPNDITYARAKEALRRLRGMEKGAEQRRRATLLGAEPARFGPLLALTPLSPLNPEQEEAVARALAAEDFFLVHGPPGTGKSTALVEVAAQAAAQGKRVLATAASNAAVDHLLALCARRGLRVVRIGHPARVSEELLRHSLDLMVEREPEYQIARDLFDEALSLQGYARRQRTQGRSRERFQNAREAKSEAKKLFEEARALEGRIVEKILSRAQVVCATCASLGGSELAGISFDLALLDEATQAIEPIALWAFLAAPRVILAGDHRQLPPTVLSREAEEGGLGISLFERLLSDHEGAPIRVILREQYRMHARIMAFPSEEMYDGLLRAHPSVAGRTLQELLREDAVVDAPPVLFLDTAGKGFEEEVAEGTESFQNPGEAALLRARVQELLGAGLASEDISIIAPYRAQVALLHELLAGAGIEGVEVDTVDAFQGRENEVILLSLTRSNPEGTLGFLNDLRRMNVALTRARRHLFVVGDSATLASHPFYQRFIERTQAEEGYRSAWEWPEPE